MARVFAPVIISELTDCHETQNITPLEATHFVFSIH
jgi:hypothetical protein